MNTKKRYRLIIAVILFLTSVIIIDHSIVIPVEAKTKKYEVSAVQIKKFKKNGKYLTVTAKYAFYGKKKKMKIKLSKNCKYKYVNHGNRFPDNKTNKAIDYKEMKRLVNSCKTMNENWNYYIDIYVKNKKIVKVVFNCV